MEVIRGVNPLLADSNTPSGVFISSTVPFPIWSVTPPNIESTESSVPKPLPTVRLPTEAIVSPNDPKERFPAKILVVPLIVRSTPVTPKPSSTVLAVASPAFLFISKLFRVSATEPFKVCLVVPFKSSLELPAVIEPSFCKSPLTSTVYPPVEASNDWALFIFRFLFTVNILSELAPSSAPAPFRVSE